MGLLKENKAIKLRDSNHKVYCHEPYAQEMYDKLCDHMEGKTITPKDMVKGQICTATIESISRDKAIAQADSYAAIYLDYAKESKFLEKIGWGPLKPGMRVDVCIESATNDLYYGSVEKAYVHGMKADLMESIKSKASAYEGTIKSINDGGFIVDVGGLDCFMPGSLAAANKILNFESMLGKKVYVMVETYLDSSDMFVVSVKKYIQHILPTKIKELDMTDKYTGTVTGRVDYGVFVEWDELFTGLLHESEITDADWKALKPGEEVTFYIKEIRENNRIILSQKGPNPEILSLIQFKDKYEGETFPNATIKDIKHFGIFVEMGSVTGMMSPREFKRSNQRPKVGDILDVFVKQVDIASRKIYLKNDEEQ